VLEGQGVAVVKIDVEGHELEALEGLKETIERSKGLVMFIECNPLALARAGHSAKALVEKLAAYGCSVEWAEVISSRGSEVMNYEDFTRLISGTRQWYNSTLKCARL
jgi:hypothetical protein